MVAGTTRSLLKPTGTWASTLSAPVTGYLGLSATVGSVAGAGALLGRMHLLSPLLSARLEAFHPLAMLLFVGVPGFLGVFGRLFLTRDLCPGRSLLSPLRGVSGLDGVALSLMLASFIAFLAWGYPALALGLWALGSVLMAAITVATILDSRAGAGVVPPAGMTRTADKPVFSVFVWSQLAASIGVLVTAPILGAAVTRGPADSTVSVVQSLSLPLTLVVLVAALGLAARIFEVVAPVERRTTLAAGLLMGLAADGGAAFWARSAVTHGSPALLHEVGNGLAATVALAFTLMWVRTLWRRPVGLTGAAGVPVLWMSAFFILLGAGWGGGVHGAVLNGVVFALFGSFYCWMNEFLGAGYPRTLARVQCGLMLAGALVLSSPSAFAQMGGGLMMAFSLPVLVAVIAGSLRRELRLDATVAEGSR